MVCVDFFFFHSSCNLLDLHSFPTRRSSDLPTTETDRKYLDTHLKAVQFKRCHHIPDPEFNCRTHPQILRGVRSEEHTSELQSRPHLVCRLLLEKKKIRSLTQAGRASTTHPS